jgi:hypothetical protein
MEQPAEDVELMLKIEQGRQLAFLQKRHQIMGGKRSAEIVTAEMLNLLFDSLCGL